MAHASYGAIAKNLPELLQYDLDILVGTLDRRTMQMHFMDFSPEALY